MNPKNYTDQLIRDLLARVGPQDDERTRRSMILASRVCEALKEFDYSVEELTQISSEIECNFHRLDINDWDAPTKIELWREAYSSGRLVHPPVCLGEYTASNLTEAICCYLKENPEKLQLYSYSNERGHQLWGNRLFDNEAEAKKSVS